MVGLPCSGKTTLARQLEQELPALRLTPDEWHLPLFGDDEGEVKHDTRHSLIEALLWDIAARALALGVNVILDYGFWAREEREDYRDEPPAWAQAVRFILWMFPRPSFSNATGKGTPTGPKGYSIFPRNISRNG